MAMGRWVIAFNGYLCRSDACASSGMEKNGSGSKCVSMRLRRRCRRLLAVRLALRGEAELLQHFGIDVDVDRFGVTRQAVALGPFQVTLIPVAHVLVGLGQLVMEHAVVLFVHFPLLGVGLALHELLAALAAPAGQEADTGVPVRFRS